MAVMGGCKGASSAMGLYSKDLSSLTDPEHMLTGVSQASPTAGELPQLPSRRTFWKGWLITTVISPPPRR